MTPIRPNVETSWVNQTATPEIHKSSYVDPMAVVIGDVIIGEGVNIAPGAILRADEGMPIRIGDGTNVQDGVIIHALKGEEVRIGRGVSLAHGAIIHGPVTIGDGTFVGFGSVVYRCQVGERCVILHNAVVSGSITIPDGKFIASCRLVRDERAVQALPDVTDDMLAFAEEVVEVNRELAEGYLRSQ